MYIVLDIGATNTRIARSSKGNSLDVVKNYPTPADYKTGVEQIIQHAQELGDEQITKMVIGVAGAFNKLGDSFIHAGNLKDWSNHKLAEDLAKRLSCEVIIKNDVALAALGEAKTGAGKNFQSIIYYSIGTGIGGAWVQKNQLSNIHYNFEPGHQIIDINNHLTLEQLAAGGKIEGAKEMPDEELWDKIKSPLITGLHNSFLHWPSEAIILGGGVINKSNFFLLEIERALAKQLHLESEAPKVLKSKHGDTAGLHGALELL